jgi:para-nitrobenzyl esterase
MAEFRKVAGSVFRRALVGQIGVLLAACAGAGPVSAGPVVQAAGPSTTAQVVTPLGTLQGVADADVVKFLGVPYALPPVGPRRFASPQPVAAWNGVRDATKFAAMCPQGKTFIEDCLYLNVLVPRAAHPGKPRPVMVWLHGGGLSGGSPNTYDATRLATQGDVIFVGVEFRVNIFGFYAVDGLDGAGTFGFQDQQAALRWVRKNIAAFGGDPSNVTVFGESGGGISVCAQLVSPGARGLINKAITQSGTCSISWPYGGPFPEMAASAYFEPLAAIEARGRDTAKKLGCDQADRAGTLACLRALPAEKLAGESGHFYSGAYGTPVLPIDPMQAVADGRHLRMPLLTGNTRDESRAVASAYQLLGKPITDANFTGLIDKAFGARAPEILRRYPVSRYGQPALAWSAIYTDRMFACAVLRDARLFARAMPTFAYEFADPNGVGLIPFLPGLPSGASHSSELPLLFDLADGPIDMTTGKKKPMSPAQRELAGQMIGYWSRFAHTGDPNEAGATAWPRFTPGTQGKAFVLVPGSAPSLEDTWSEHQCDFWQPFLAR